MTGESIPIEKETGDKVYCGTFNESGSCELQATQVAEDTKLAHIKRLILEAQVEVWMGRLWRLSKRNWSNSWNGCIES